MAIKPIDMQVLLPKLHKNDLLKPHVVHRVENEQQMLQNVSQQDAQEKLNRVNTYERKDGPQVREDGRRGEGGGSGEQEQKPKDKDKEPADKSKAAKPTAGRSHIDIKV